MYDAGFAPSRVPLDEIIVRIRSAPFCLLQTEPHPRTELVYRTQQNSAVSRTFLDQTNAIVHSAPIQGLSFSTGQATRKEKHQCIGISIAKPATMPRMFRAYKINYEVQKDLCAAVGLQ